MSNHPVRTRTRGSADPGQLQINRKILLVEDQRSLALVAAKMLHERWGCQVLITTTLEEARAAIAQKQNNDFFVAVSDLTLPDAPHGEIIDVLIGAGLPTIAITGNYNSGLRETIMSKGVIDYVLKNSINAYEYIVELVGRLYKNTHIKVLVVDDSAGFRHLLEFMLKMQNLQVITARDGVDALQQLELNLDIKLVLVDNEMPNMRGTEFVASVRRKWSKDKLAVIGISAAEDKDVTAQFLKLGANDFIIKPFIYEELVCRVSHTLETLESIEAVRYIAYHDYLTGQLNRRAFFDQGGKLFAKAVKEGRPLAVAMMDIDFFKKVNDTYGHDGGDVVLKHFSALLEEHFRDNLVGRLGGEEFALIILGDTRKSAERCEAFRLHVEKAPAQFGDKLISFTVSTGMTQKLQPNLDATLKLADENLYKAKETGRNRIIFT